MKTKAVSSPEAESTTREALPLHSQARVTARTVLSIGLVLVAAWVALDFLPALGWGAVLAMALWPLYVRVVPSSTAHPPIAIPLIFTLVIGGILVVPLALAVHQIVQGGNAIVGWMSQVRESGIPAPSWISQLPAVGGDVEQWWRQNLADPAAAARWLNNVSGERIANWMQAIGGDLMHRAGMLLVALLALFVMLRDGAWLSRRVMETADRILGDPGERLASKMAEAVRGTVNGTVAVALGEGVLIGIAYFVAGVRSPFLFMMLTAAFAMLPFGAWFAFSAASLVLLFDGGSGWAALAIFGWGAAVMLIGDHFVWPTLVSGAARLPFLLALVGIFGGLQTFGLLGLFLGPTIMAALLTVWREWLVARASEAA